jgi:hypothetical protein
MALNNSVEDPRVNRSALQTNSNYLKVLAELQLLGNEVPLSSIDDPRYQQFIQRYPAERLSQLSLAEYCVGKGDGESFCWWLEHGLQPLLGRYMPGTSRGHILYFQKDGLVYKNRRLNDLSDTDALTYTLEIQAAIAQADMNADLDWIDDDQLLYQRADVEPRVTMGHGRKLRLLSCYHPEETLPISSSLHLGHFLKILGCPESDIPPSRQPVARMMLLREYLRLAQETVPGLSPVEFMRVLYKPELGLAPVDEDANEEINSEDEIAIVLTAGAIRNGYIRIPKTQNLFPGECVAANEQTEVEPFTLVLPDDTEIQTCLLANRSRIKARFNSLFNKHGLTDGDRVRIQKSADRRYVMRFEQQDPDDEDTNSRQTMPMSIPLAPVQPLNQILYGPPGTGKTYSTVDAALAVLDHDFLEQHCTDRTALKSRFDALVRERRIRFVTFHQSFSYEDFVEGLRATTNEETGQIRYEVVDGVFKSLCEAAAARVTRPIEAATAVDPFDIRGRRVWKMSLGNTLGSDAAIYDECIEKGYALLGYGGGVDFTGCTSRDDMLSRFTDNGLKVENPQTDYAVTSVVAFVTRMKPGDLMVVSDGNFKFRAIGEVSSEYQYRPRNEFADEYAQMRAVKWLRTYEPSLPYGELMNNQFSQMTLYELRPGSIDLDKLQGLLNQESYRAPKVGGLFPGAVTDSTYEIVRANADIVELRKPQGRTLHLGMSLIQELAQAVKAGKISIADIREKHVMNKLTDTSMDPFLVNGYNNVLAPLVAQLIGADGSQSLTAQAPALPDARVLIIDEINRGNISRIFGELITLIEPSKRAGASEALEVLLPYSKRPFSVPQNVYLIGTMNTADRSLTGMDVALRRRFVFKAMPPRPHLLNGVEVEGISIERLLAVLNQRIEALLDRDHCLGHAYFMPLRQTPTLTKLAEIFSNQVLPLLQEYFFDDWQRIQWVLNDHRKPEEFQFVIARGVGVDELFGADVNVTSSPKGWTVNYDAFQYAESYLCVIDFREA